jgi:hypothetical protein
MVKIRRNNLAIQLGPLLKFSGIEGGKWKISILLICDADDQPPVLELAPPGIPTLDKPKLLKSWGEQSPTHKVWRYDLAIPQSPATQKITYTVGQTDYALAVPAKSEPPACAYASCNGFSDPKLMKKVKDKNALWKKMYERHQIRPYHLLLLGGDQIYTDSIWQEVPSLQQWVELSLETRNQAAFTQQMQAEVDKFFFQLYLSRLRQAEVANMLSSIPTVMMWDDHDIFDNSPVFQGIFCIAREYFQLFQLHSNAATPPAGLLPNQTGFNCGFRVGAYGILALDLRSERTEEQVMTHESWNAVYQWLDQQKGCSHLLVLSSIPVIHPDFATLETLLRALPGQQELEDDLRDHWLSRPHRQERLRMIHRFLGWSAEAKGRVTLISGDVHVGALGILESDREDTPINARIINQLTASGIVHPAPPAMALFYLEHVGDRVEQVDRGITATMFQFPGTSHRYIGARNFLSLEPDTPESNQGRLWANWWVEGEASAYTKVIHPVPEI